MEILLPRMERMTSSGSVTRSAPSNVILPERMKPGEGTSRMMDSAVNDLPDPDSPTRATVLPLSTFRLTSLTAAKTPWEVLKHVLRFLIESRALTVVACRKGLGAVITETALCWYQGEPLLLAV